MSKLKVKEGVCPECGKALFNYERHDIDGASLAYHVMCTCGWEGLELHRLVFEGYE